VSAPSCTSVIVAVALGSGPWGAKWLGCCWLPQQASPARGDDRCRAASGCGDGDGVGGVRCGRVARGRGGSVQGEGHGSQCMYVEGGVVPEMHARRSGTSARLLLLTHSPRACSLTQHTTAAHEHTASASLDRHVIGRRCGDMTVCPLLSLSPCAWSRCVLVAISRVASCASRQ